MTTFSNSQCYELETIEYDKGIFPDVDATYIIHLRDNGRHEHIMDELAKTHPTNTVHLVVNTGFKTCEKRDLRVPSSVFDLIDAFLYVFHDAIQKNYQSVLILEDDFIFDEKVGDHSPAVCEFLRSKKGEEYVYALGCLPFAMMPYNSTTYRGILTMGMHSVIYSRAWMEKVVHKRQDIDDWDLYHNLHIVKYVYYTPLCYQLFPATENKSNWGGENWLYRLGAMCIKAVIWLLSLETQIHPGYDIMYFLSKLFMVLVAIEILVRYVPWRRHVIPWVQRNVQSVY